MVFGLVSYVLGVRGPLAKRVFSLLLGVLIALVGFDPVFYSFRLTFGRPELLGGFIGIPGDSVTAIVLGVMVMKGITPGPRIFVECGELVYSLFLIFLIDNIMIILLGILTIKFLGKFFLRTPDYVLIPLILVFSIVGSYAVDYSFFNVMVMLIFGIVGFFMHEYGFPYSPMILGTILGRMMETYFVMTYIKGGMLAFFNRPLSLAIIVTIALIIVIPWIAKKIRFSDRLSHPTYVYEPHIASPTVKGLDMEEYVGSRVLFTDL